MIIHNLDEKIKAEEERRAIIFSQTVSTWQPPESWAVDDENNRLSRKSTMKNVDKISNFSKELSESEDLKDDEQIMPFIRSLIPEGKTVS